jgi:hypothetical protein
VLRFNDHVFANTSLCVCCTTDKRVIIDPTDTTKLRGKMIADARRRANQLRNATNAMIAKQDILGLKASSALQIMAPGVMLAGTRQEMFQRWLNQALVTLVMGNDGTWMRPYLDRSYDMGVIFGNVQLKASLVPTDARHRKDSLFALAKMELQGIMDATSQQGTRVANLGIATQSTPMTIVRGVWEVIERTMVYRINAMISLLTVKAFGDGTLDVYEVGKVKNVGLIPEAANAKAQSATTDAKKVAKTSRKTGPGSRVSRKKQPSTRTIQRIKRLETSLVRKLGENVNIRTAGDDDVCPVCEAISENGPYSINRARALIPAHPRCRCAFIPADDGRYATDDDEITRDALAFVAALSDYNPNHGPDGRFESGGGHIEENALARTPREGTKKHQIFQTYVKHGREAAIKQAKELGLAPTTAGTWTSEWKKEGTHGGTEPFHGGPTPPPPPPSPTPPVHTPPTPPPPTPKARKPRTPKPPPSPIAPTPTTPGQVTWKRHPPIGVKPSAHVDIVGEGEHRAAVERGLASIPEEHRKALAARGLKVHVRESVSTGKYGDVQGVYRSRSDGWGSVEIARTARVRGHTLKLKDPEGTTIHELGHAVDHASGWRHGEEIAPHVNEDAKKMSTLEKRYAQYYFSNNKERYAELYHVAHGKGAEAFGMPMHRAKEVFATSIEKLKGMKL